MKKGNELISEIRRVNPPQDGAAFWWIGQMGIIAKGAGKICCIDCFFSDFADRLVKPVIYSEEADFPDFIFGTHDHADHIDRDAWITASKLCEARFVIPNYLIETLPEELGIDASRFIGIRDSETVKIAEGIKVTGVPAAHEFLDYDAERDEYPYMGYVIEMGTVRLYHSGDCCYYEGLLPRLRSFGTLDYAFLPINGRDAQRYANNCIGNFTFQEAVDLAGALKPRLAVPCHYDMFPGNTEDPLKFRDYMKVKYPEQAVWIGEHGGRIDVSLQEG